jgi:adenylate cyclase
MLINYSGPAGTYPYYSAANVADGIVLEENPDVFRDKIVLIGATTITLQDVHPTPFSSKETTPGVEIVANAVETIIKGRYLREASPWVSLVLIALAALVAALLTRSHQPGKTIVLMTVAMLAYAFIGFIVFTVTRTYLPFTAPELMLFLGVVLPTLEQAVSQELEKRRVRSMFSRFVSPEMVDQLITTQDINSLNKRADLTILFSDIRGFTALSEKLSPEEVVALLNPYLEAMTEIIYKHSGTVDKYEGDAILAFYGEPDPYPDHAARAVRTAVEMRTALENLRRQWVQEGRVSESFEMGVGLNSGEVFVGLLGSAQRINYTVIGDNVNLAARIQDLTKTYKWPILVSEATYQQVKDEFECELVDSVIVKGKTEAVKLYCVRGVKGMPPDKLIQPWTKL